MRLPGDPRLPEDTPTLLRQLQRLFVQISQQVNGITEGRIESYHGAQTAAPTAGEWKQGDFVTKSNPVESGTGGSKYVIIGYMCTVSGTPGTWVECRCLTGN